MDAIRKNTIDTVLVRADVPFDGKGPKCLNSRIAYRSDSMHEIVVYPDAGASLWERILGTLYAFSATMVLGGAAMYIVANSTFTLFHNPVYVAALVAFSSLWTGFIWLIIIGARKMIDGSSDLFAASLPDKTLRHIRDGWAIPYGPEAAIVLARGVYEYPDEDGAFRYAKNTYIQVGLAPDGDFGRRLLLWTWGPNLSFGRAREARELAQRMNLRFVDLRSKRKRRAAGY